MLLYLLKFSSCLLILLTAYKLFLEKESLHTFKRFYLLAALVLALVIPLITFTTYITPVASTAEEAIYSTTTPEGIQQKTNSEYHIAYTTIILWCLYSVGVLVLSVRFIVNLGALTKTVRQNQKIKLETITLVLLLKHITPHTFLSYIFLDKHLFDTQQISEEVLLHEKTHAKQKHSLDILAVELLQIVFWFHPLIYLLKTAIKMNHEFLADQAVIKQGIDTKKYFEILINHSSSSQNNQLASAINYSSIKKRIIIMKTKTSRKAKWLKMVALVPIACLLVYSFSSRKEVIKESSVQATKSTTTVDSGKTQQTLTKEAYFKNVHFVFDTGNGETFTKTFNELTDEEKSALNGPPSIPAKKQPTQQQLDEWKDASKYGIWIDGNRIANEEIVNYKPSDFGYYFYSKLHKNAKDYGKYNYHVQASSLQAFEKRIKEGVQPLAEGTYIKIKPINNNTQFKKYQKEGVTNAQELINLFKSTYEQYETLRTKQPEYRNKNAEDQNALDSMFLELQQMFIDLSITDRTKVTFPKKPSDPYFKIVDKKGNVTYKLLNELSTNEKQKIIPPPPPPAPPAPPAPKVPVQMQKNPLIGPPAPSEEPTEPKC